MARPRSEMGDIRTSPRNRRILAWLRRKPELAKVVGNADDENEVTCAVAGPTTQELHDVISVVRECEELRGFDAKGVELRRLKLDANDPELRVEREVAAAVSSGTQNSVPIISVDVPKLVDSIARNIREAVSEATRNNTHAHRGGFEAMVAVMNVALNLLVGIEQRYAQAADLLEQQRNALPPSGDPNDPEAQKRQMAMMAFQKVMGGNGAAGNGAGGFDPTKLMAFLQSMQGQQGGDENAS